MRACNLKVKAYRQHLWLHRVTVFDVPIVAMTREYYRVQTGVYFGSEGQLRAHHFVTATGGFWAASCLSSCAILGLGDWRVAAAKIADSGSAVALIDNIAILLLA